MLGGEIENKFKFLLIKLFCLLFKSSMPPPRYQPTTATSFVYHNFLFPLIYFACLVQQYIRRQSLRGSVKIEVSGAFLKPLCDDFRYMRIKYSVEESRATTLSQKTKKSFFLVQGHLRDNIKLLLYTYTHNCLVPLGCSRCFVCLEKNERETACAVMWKEKSIFLKALLPSPLIFNISRDQYYFCCL